MNDELWNRRGPVAESGAPMPEVADRASWQAELDELLVREKAHTREGETFEHSPHGWPQFWRNTGEQFSINGRPTPSGSA